MREFKIGDKVKDVRFGYGEVKELRQYADCPVHVEFADKKIDYYLNGKINLTDPYRSLFHADEEIVVPRPKKKVRIQGWVNRYDESPANVFYLHPTLEVAQRYRGGGFPLDKSPFYIDTEVEVEE